MRYRHGPDDDITPVKPVAGIRPISEATRLFGYQNVNAMEHQEINDLVLELRGAGVPDEEIHAVFKQARESHQSLYAGLQDLLNANKPQDADAEMETLTEDEVDIGPEKPGAS